MTKNLIRNESVHLGNELRLGEFKSFMKSNRKKIDNEIKEVYKLNLSNFISNHYKTKLKNNPKKAFSVQNEDGDDSSNYLDSNYNDNNNISSLNDLGTSQLFDKQKNYEKLRSNLYTSYLSYGTIDPFKTHYDFLHKKNPDFYKNLGKKLPSSNSTYSLISSSAEIKKFMRRPNTKKKESLNNELEDQKISNYNEIHPVKNIDRVNCLSQNSSYQSLKKNTTSKNCTKEDKKNEIVPNQFLIYRNETLINKEDSIKISYSSKNLSNHAYVRNKDQQREPQGQNLSLFNKKENALVNHSKNDVLTEYRSANGPEKFLDSSKLAYILTWVNTVNRIQSIEGKHTETVNKIFFYD